MLRWVAAGPACSGRRGFWARNRLWACCRHPTVTNDDFRAWRKAHGKGGDLLLFSDVMVVPVQFEVRS
jgi:hypothetical protein